LASWSSCPPHVIQGLTPDAVGKYLYLYIRKWGFWLDVRLIPVSFWITFRGKWEHRGEKL